MSAEKRGYSDQSERGVLGSALRDNESVDELATIVQARHFRSDAHQRLWSAILQLREQGQPVLPDTLADYLKKAGGLADVGYELLAELWEHPGTFGNGLHLARIVKDNADYRDVMLTLQTLLAEGETYGGAATELRAVCEQRILDLSEIGIQGGAVPWRQVLSEVSDQLDARRCGGKAATAVMSGFIDLDIVVGGFRPGELIVLAGRPGTGKTAMACNLVSRICQRGLGVYFASIEQKREELGLRILSSLTNVEHDRLRDAKLSPEQWAEVASCRTRYEDWSLFIDDSPDQKLAQIGANARRLVRKRQVRIVLVDYLQLVGLEESKRGRWQQRHEIVGAVSRGLKQLARNLNCPVLALAQLNREVENRSGGKPRLADLRESGAIEADADVVMALSQTDQRGKVIDVTVLKNRNGRTEEFYLYFRDHLQRFEDYTPE